MYVPSQKRRERARSSTRTQAKTEEAPSEKGASAGTMTHFDTSCGTYTVVSRRTGEAGNLSSEARSTKSVEDVRYNETTAHTHTHTQKTRERPRERKMIDGSGGGAGGCCVMKKRVSEEAILDKEKALPVEKRLPSPPKHTTYTHVRAVTNKRATQTTPNKIAEAAEEKELGEDEETMSRRYTRATERRSDKQKKKGRVGTTEGKRGNNGDEEQHQRRHE